MNLRERLGENTYTFVFALIICVICSFALAAVSEGLRSKRELNEALDIKKNILKAVDLREPVDPKATPQEILSVYEDKIEELIINSDGQIQDGKTLADTVDNDKLFPLYRYKEGRDVIAYCFPIIGKGLWSTLYGYLALEPDAITVRGITYYKHGETPGLGAEIETDWFQNNFKGKKIYDIKTSELFPVSVVKGKVQDKFQKEEDQKYYVDGISGATMTSLGVTEMLDREVRKYDPFFKKIRTKSLE